jgi:hypothetical protein
MKNIYPQGKSNISLFWGYTNKFKDRHVICNIPFIDINPVIITRNTWKKLLKECPATPCKNGKKETWSSNPSDYLMQQIDLKTLESKISSSAFLSNIKEYEGKGIRISFTKKENSSKYNLILRLNHENEPDIDLNIHLNVQKTKTKDRCETVDELVNKIKQHVEYFFNNGENKKNLYIKNGYFNPS